MFKCEKCKALEAEVKFLREQNTKLTDRLSAIADARAFVMAGQPASSSGDYYGSGDDELVAYSDWGEKIVCKKDKESN